MMGTRVGLLWLLFAWLPSAQALAHKPSDSYLKITGGAETLTAQFSARC